MEDIKEFKEIMEINDLNKNLDEKSDKDSAEGDTETDQEELSDDGKEQINEVEMDQIIKKRSSKRSRKNKKVDGDSSEVEEGDKGANDEDEEKLPEVKFPSKLTEDEKLTKIGRFQTRKKKEKKELVEDKNNIKDESSDDEDESGENKRSLHHKLEWDTIEKVITYVNLKLFFVIFALQCIMQQLEVYFAYSLGNWAQDMFS